MKFSQKGSALVPSLEKFVSSKNPSPFSHFGGVAVTKTSTTFYERCLAPTPNVAVVWLLKPTKEKYALEGFSLRKGARTQCTAQADFMSDARRF